MRFHIHFHRRVEHPYGKTHFFWYGQCRCGKRKVEQVSWGGWQPGDTHWLRTGEWDPGPDPVAICLAKPGDAGMSRP